MSSLTVGYLKYVTNQSNIYGGFFFFVTGIIGNILNIIIFTSLKTFRETSAAFYMNITSIANIFQLIAGLLSRILITGYNIDPTATSPFLCKARSYILISATLINFACMCFAAIDQYLSLTNRWRHFCNVKTASRLVIIAITLCFLHSIPLLVYQDVRSSPSTNQTSCAIVDPTYSIYYSLVILVIFFGFFPLSIRIIFGLLAFICARRLENRQVPILRLERDKQLTRMVLVEVVVDVFLTLPYIIYNHIYSNAVTFSDSIHIAENQMIVAITRIVFLGNFVVAFYVYYCVSSRFRRQLWHVLFKIHLNHWRELMNRARANEIAPAN